MREATGGEELRECTPKENAPYGPMQNNARFGGRLTLQLGSRPSPARGPQSSCTMHWKSIVGSFINRSTTKSSSSP